MSLESDIKDINEGRVDSRLSNLRITHPTLPLQRTFCSFCGRPKGWVTHESSEFIEASNVVVICDDCNAKFDSKLGKLPGEEAPIQEYDIRDAELGFDEGQSNDWVENCIDCRVPMVKLQVLSASKCAPLLDTLRTGECLMDKNRLEAIRRSTPMATAQWFCRKCQTLWGPIDMFWCKFKKL